MIYCKICDTNLKSYGSLSKHLRDKHLDYSSQHYYDKFLKDVDEGKCKICGKTTKFKNLNIGYANTCGHQCAGILHRKQLSLDTDKYKKFTNRVAENQKLIWESRKDSNLSKIISKKISTTIKNSNANKTPIELSERYGWLNKLSATDRKNWVDSVMMSTGMHAWWKDATNHEKLLVINQRNATKLGITPEEYESRYQNIDELINYYRVAWRLTEQTYQEFKNLIDPDNRRSTAYHLDHKFSIIRGFQLQVPPEIIASRFNLEILTASDNSRKSGKCSINIETLKEMYYGKFFPGNISGNQ
jgi:hypothetical protein